MDPLVIRLASPSDARQIAEMSRCLIEVGLRGWTWHPGRVAKAIRARDSNVVVVEATGLMAGFAIMEFGDTRAHLSLLAVSPRHQRSGVGRRLMSWLEEAALAAGITTISLELRLNNFGARCFYRLLGYTETARLPGYYRNIETAVRMARDIRRRIPSPLPSLPRLP